MLIREVFVKQAPHINVGDTILHPRTVANKDGEPIIKYLFIEVLRVDPYFIWGVYEQEGKRNNIQLCADDGCEFVVAEKLSMEY